MRMDWLIEGALELLWPSLRRRKMPTLSARAVERAVCELQAKHDRAKIAGEPLICEFPASLRSYRPTGRVIGRLSKDEAVQRTWAPGMLHVGATGLAWEPLPGRASRPWDLTTAMGQRETAMMVSSNPNRATWKLIMQVQDREVEVAMRLAFLPFARVGIEQAAHIRAGSPMRGTVGGNDGGFHRKRDRQSP
jgi:hypothetical protein